MVARLKKTERRSGRTSIGESTVPRPPRLSHEDGFPLLCVLRARLWLSANTTGGRGNKSRFQLRDNGQYAESSFAGPEAVLAYLARYTHRVAIANSRLIALDERGVTFRYKDYRRNGQARYRTMTLGAEEFIRRFLLHVLPKGFHRIRHYGLLASANCKTNIARARGLMAAPIPEPVSHDTVNPDSITDHRPPCPCCGGRMIIVEVFARGAAPRGPPPSGAGIRT